MTILLWLLSLIVYVVFLAFTGIFFDINLYAGIVALILGIIAIGMNNRILSMLSYGFILLGELVLYNYVMARGLLVIWLLAIVLTIFLASLSLRQE